VGASASSRSFYRPTHWHDTASGIGFAFDLRAAGPALLCNTSYFESRICHWDAAALRAT
jgi:hypothetical protein